MSASSNAAEGVAAGLHGIRRNASGPADTVHTILADHFGKPADFIRDEHTLADLGDSLEYLEAVIALADEFGVQITSAEADAANTVGKLIALVEQKMELRRMGLLDAHG